MLDLSNCLWIVYLTIIQIENMDLFPALLGEVQTQLPLPSIHTVRLSFLSSQSNQPFGIDARTHTRHKNFLHPVAEKTFFHLVPVSLAKKEKM